MRVDQLEWEAVDAHGYWCSARTGKLRIYAPTEKLLACYPERCYRNHVHVYLYKSAEDAINIVDAYQECWWNTCPLLLQCLLNEYGGGDV